MIKLVSKDKQASDIVSLQEAKRQCYLLPGDIDFEDDILITSLLEASIKTAEGLTWQAIIPSTYDLILDEFPKKDILIEKTPVISVVSINYVDVDGNTAVFSADNYSVDIDSIPARVRVKENWPTLKDEELNAVKVRFKAGYDMSSDAYMLPATIRQAILLLVKHFYDHRDTVTFGGSPVEVPFTVSSLLGLESNREFV